MDVPKRRLSAVWFADIVAYSTLSSRDEPAALSLVSKLQAHAREIVASYEGRIVKFIGDAVLAEFTSTDSAVRAATSLQERYCADAAAVGGPSSKLRIGVHLGEVASQDGDLYGDGINTAARLQHEAKPGQVLVSEDVWRQLRQRPEFRFVSLGPIELKGITTSVGVYDVLFGAQAALARPKDGGLEATHARSRTVYAASVVAVVLTAVLAVALWMRRAEPTPPRADAGTPAPRTSPLGNVPAGSPEKAADGNTSAAKTSEASGTAAKPKHLTAPPADPDASVGGREDASSTLGPADLPAVRSLLDRLATALASEHPMQALAPLGQGAMAMGRREIPQMRQVFGQDITLKVGAVEPRGVRGNAGFVRVQFLVAGSTRPETPLFFDALIVRTPQGLKLADLERSQPGRRGAARGSGGARRGRQ